MEREGAAVTCDGTLFYRRAAATGNAPYSSLYFNFKGNPQVLESRSIDEHRRERCSCLHRADPLVDNIGAKRTADTRV